MIESWSLHHHHLHQRQVWWFRSAAECQPSQPFRLSHYSKHFSHLPKWPEPHVIHFGQVTLHLHFRFNILTKFDNCLTSHKMLIKRANLIGMKVKSTRPPGPSAWIEGHRLTVAHQAERPWPTSRPGPLTFCPQRKIHVPCHWSESVKRNSPEIRRNKIRIIEKLSLHWRLQNEWVYLNSVDEHAVGVERTWAQVFGRRRIHRITVPRIHVTHNQIDS